MPVETYRFRGLDIPVPLLHRAGSAPENIELFARQHLSQIESLAPVRPTHRVLELGCGPGFDAVLLATMLGGTGSYDGVDLDAESVHWCTSNIASRHPNFRFHHANIQSTQYNPEGSVSPSAYTFPVEDGRIDRVFAQSLFTHLLPDGAARYLSETRRVLRPDGLALFTFFTGDERELRESACAKVPFFRIAQPWSEGCFVCVPQIPEASVAYTAPRLLELLREAGLELARPILPGRWIESRKSTCENDQDLVLLRRAG